MTAIKPALLRVKDAALILSVSEWEVRRLVDVGILHRRYIGESSRYFRVTAQSVDNYLDSLTSDPS